jgi:hypothetical protein
VTHREITRGAEFLREWSTEHLVYEIDQLAEAVHHFASEPGESDAAIRLRNALIESFAVHVRCLGDFLWNDRTGDTRVDDDAFAADFCEPDEWDRKRARLVWARLEKVAQRRRIGREIVHLTYNRISGSPAVKVWEMAEIMGELAAGLAAFAEIADDRLSDEAREACAAFRDRVPDIPGDTGGGATGMAGPPATADPYHGGTINPRTSQS